jgi:outer membrane lipoprotein carrier protein
MFNIFNIFFILFLSITCTKTFAVSANDTVTGLLLNIHTMSADFVQTVQDKKSRVLQQSHGYVALQRPGKFYWEVKNPTRQVIIANGARLWIYDPDLEQVTIRAFSKATGQTPAFLLSDANLTLGKDFVVNSIPAISQIAGTQNFVLIPKDHDNVFAKIQLSFINKQIHEMVLEDQLGHTTKIAFQHVKNNSPLSAALFNFKPPAQVDVIDETRRK